MSLVLTGLFNNLTNDNADYCKNENASDCDRACEQPYVGFGFGRRFVFRRFVFFLFNVSCYGNFGKVEVNEECAEKVCFIEVIYAVPSV